MKDHTKVISAFGNSVAGGMEKNAAGWGVALKAAGGLRGALSSPNMLLRYKQLFKSSGGGKIGERAVAAMSKRINKVKAFNIKADMFNRATGQGPIQRTGLEKAWGAAKTTALGVGTAGILGAGALTYGALHRPATSDFSTLSER